MSGQSLYDEDFYQWTVTNAELLRTGRYTEADILNIIEEIESMGRSEKRTIASRLEVLLRHLLKWQFQPAKRSDSWKHTIDVQRQTLQERLEESPSLRGYPREKLAVVYKRAVDEASFETKLPKGTFPAECPYTIDEIFDPAYYPW